MIDSDLSPGSRDACFACGAPEDYDNPMRRDYAGVPVCARGCLCVEPQPPLLDAILGKGATRIILGDTDPDGDFHR